MRLFVILLLSSQFALNGAAQVVLGESNRAIKNYSINKVRNDSIILIAPGYHAKKLASLSPIDTVRLRTLSLEMPEVSVSATRKLEYSFNYWYQMGTDSLPDQGFAWIRGKGRWMPPKSLWLVADSADATPEIKEEICEAKITQNGVRIDTWVAIYDALRSIQADSVLQQTWVNAGKNDLLTYENPLIKPVVFGHGNRLILWNLDSYPHKKRITKNVIGFTFKSLCPDLLRP